MVQTILAVMRAMAALTAALAEMHKAVSADPALQEKLRNAKSAVQAVADHQTE